MGVDRAMKRFFSRWFQSENDKGKFRSIFKKSNVLIIAFIGLLLIIFSNVFTKNDAPPGKEDITLSKPEDEKILDDHELSNDQGENVTYIEQRLQNELEVMINKIEGISEAEVMVHLDSSGIQVYEKNLIKGKQTTDETDQSGGIRKVQDETEESQAVLIREGDREIPLLIHQKQPEVRGVFIVAKGVDHSSVQLSVVDAVSKVLDLSTHKISVMPKK